jgi:TRAP-type C4-dicarboxylate transport system permease small subunit
MRALEALHGFVSRSNSALLWLAKWLAIACLVVMLVIVNVSVFQRYVMNDALPWSEEIAKFVMVWLTFMSAPIGLKIGAHMAIEVLVQSLRGRMRQILYILIFAGIISLMYVFVTTGWFLTLNARMQRASTIDVSIFYVYICIPIGSALVASVAFEFLLGAVMGVIDPDKGFKPPAQELVQAE